MPTRGSKPLVRPGDFFTKLANMTIVPLQVSLVRIQSSAWVDEDEVALRPLSKYLNLVTGLHVASTSWEESEAYQVCVIRCSFTNKKLLCFAIWSTTNTLPDHPQRNALLAK